MKTRRHVRPPSALVPMLLCGFLGAAAMADNAMANINARMQLTKPAAAAGGGHQHHGHQPGQQAQGKAQPQQQAQPRRRGGGKKLQLVNGEGAVVKFWAPDLNSQEIVLEGDRFTIPKPAVDNYHAVVAERQQGNLKQAAIRYEYMRSRPSSESPSKLAGAQKTEFEIVPDPIPREHHRYMTDAKWEFIARLGNLPVSDVRVTLETSHGSRVHGMTDEEGRVRFTLPDDFPEVKSGRRKNPSAELHVYAEHRQDQTLYQTDLSAPYYVGAHHWTSTAQGLVFVGLGLLAGGLISAAGRRNGG
ncbi:hypothetical protein ACFL0R_03030 [Pseudomonadota bacterium]